MSIGPFQGPFDQKSISLYFLQLYRIRTLFLKEGYAYFSFNKTSSWRKSALIVLSLNYMQKYLKYPFSTSVATKLSRVLAFLIVCKLWVNLESSIFKKLMRLSRSQKSRLVPYRDSWPLLVPFRFLFYMAPFQRIQF